MDLFMRLDRHVKDMSARELKTYFNKKCEISFLMRSIIMNEKEFAMVHEERSLRSLWYSTVKPTLDKLDLLTEQDNTEEGLTKWDSELSRYVADLVKRGYLTYQSLNITDNSRKRENPANYYDVDHLTTYGNQVSINKYSNIIIATEKDTVYNNIAKIAKLLGCSCISSKGQNSLAAMESLIRGMSGSFKKIFILTLTDYDPAGYYIADALEKQVHCIIKALGMEDVEVYIRRIGITPDQLSDEMIEANKYTPKKTNLDKWMSLTNGINGEPKGLELDALSAEEIRRIFVENIKEFIDPKVYREFIKRSYIRKLALDEMSEKIDIILEKLINKYEKKLVLEDFDITEIAVDGYSSLPIRSLCSYDLDDEIREQVNKYFKRI